MRSIVRGLNVITPLMSLYIFCDSLPHEEPQQTYYNNIFPLYIETPSRNEIYKSHRSIRGDKLKELNDLFEGTVLSLPDTSVRDDLGGIWGSVLYTISDMTCFNIKVGFIKVRSTKTSANTLEYGLDVNGIDFDCNFRWRYDYGVHGTGRGQIYTQNNFLNNVIVIKTNKFNVLPQAQSKSCASVINVQDLDFQGGLDGFLANAFEKSFRGQVENSIQAVLCEEMVSISVEIETQLRKMATHLDPYYEDIPPDDTDPLSAEAALITDHFNALDFKDSESLTGKSLTYAMQTTFAFLGTPMDDPDNPSTKILGINNILRCDYLDENGAYNLHQSDEEKWFIEGHDRMTQFRIIMNKVSLVGVDNISIFDEITIIGPQTLRGRAKWDDLEVKIEFTIEMLPSTLEDSMILSTENEQIIEHISVTIPLNSLDINYSFLFALDEDKLGKIAIGSILHQHQLLPCVLSSHHSIELTEIKYNTGTFMIPSLKGFISEALDEVLNDSAEAFHMAYRLAIEDALPNMFATTIKERLNRVLMFYFENDKNTLCPLKDAISEFIDFRELLLSPGKAEITGTGGNIEYGSLPPLIKSKVDLTILEPDEMNRLLIRPLTRKQSNESGTLIFTEYASNTTICDFSLLFFDWKVENLDTFAPSKRFLQPINNNPYTLENELEVGTVSKPIRGLVSLIVSIADGEGGIGNQNKLDLSVEFVEAEIISSMFIKVLSSSLFEIPLEDAMNINCWLAAISTSHLDEDSFQVDSMTLPDFFLSRFEVNHLQNSRIKVECVSCTIPELIELPQIIETLESDRVNSHIASGLLNYLQDIATSDYMQTYLNRIVHNASASCPHHVNYNNSRIEEYHIPPLPYPSLDVTTLFAGLASQVILTMIALNAASSAGRMDPLSGEKSLQVSNSNVGSFYNFSVSPVKINNLINSILQPTEGLNSHSTVSGINALTQSFLLDGDFALKEVFNPLSYSVGDYEFTLFSLRIFGLNSFSSVDLYNVMSDYTIQNIFSLQNMTLEFHVTSRKVDHGTDKPSVTKEEDFNDMTISIEMLDVKVTLVLMMALDETAIGEIQLGSLVAADSLLECVFSNTYSMDVTKAVVGIRSFDTVIRGLLSDEAKSALATSASVLYDSYATNITSALSSLVQERLNDVITKFNENSTCPYSHVDEYGEFVDLRDLFLNGTAAEKMGGLGTRPYGDTIMLGMNFIRDILMNPDRSGSPSINDKIIRPFAEAQSGNKSQLYYPGKVLRLNLDEFGLDMVGIKRGSEAMISNMFIDNIDSFGYPFQIMRPRHGRTDLVDNIVTVGTGDRPLRLEAKLTINVTEDEGNHINEIDLRVELDTLTLFPSVIAKIDRKMLMEHPIRLMNDFSCWFSTIPAPGLNNYGIPKDRNSLTLLVDELELTFKNMSLEANCVNCISPAVKELSSLASLIESPVVFSRLFEELMTSKAAQDQIARYQNRATKRCQMSDEDESAPRNTYDFTSLQFSDDSYMLSITLFASRFFVILIALTLLRYISLKVKHRHEKWVLTLTEDEIHLLYCQQLHAERQDTELCRLTTSMASSKVIPTIVRWTIPLAIIGNMALFLSGHLNLGASVDVSGQFLGQSIEFDDIYKFSIMQSTIDMWNSGAQALSAIIFLFSVLYPYIKLASSLFLWFLPPTKLSVKKRGIILQRQEMLAKWSVLDIYILFITVVAFRISLKSPDGSMTSIFYEIESMVVPLCGFYTNLTAQFISQLCSRVLVYYNRQIVETSVLAVDECNSYTTRPISEEGSLHHRSMADIEIKMDECSLNQFDPIESLCKHNFKLRTPNEGAVEVPLSTNVLVGMLGILSTLCLSIGCILPSFRLEVLGILGLVINAGSNGEDRVEYHSLFSIVRLIIKQASHFEASAQLLGMRTLVAVLIITTVIIPLFLVAASLYVWYVPMRRNTRHRIIAVIVILKAWQYIEVFTASVVLATWQLGGVSKLMLFTDDYCATFDKTFAALVYYGFLKDVNAQCFYIKASLQGAVFALMFAFGTLTLLVFFVTEAASQKRSDEDLSDFVFNLERGSPDNEAGLDGQNHNKSIAEKLKPPLIQFTDIFKLFLSRNKPVIIASSVASYPVTDELSPVHSEDTQESDFDNLGGVPAWACSKPKLLDGHSDTVTHNS